MQSSFLFQCKHDKVIYLSVYSTFHSVKSEISLDAHVTVPIYVFFPLSTLLLSVFFHIRFQWLWKCQLDLQLWILQVSHYSDWDLEGTTGTWSCSHLPRWLALHTSTHSLWGSVDLDCYRLLLYVYTAMWLMYYTFIHWHIWSVITGSRFMCLYTAGLSGWTSVQRPHVLSHACWRSRCFALFLCSFLNVESTSLRDTYAC